MTEREEPVVRDKRRLDPETGELREAGAAVGNDGGPAAAAPADGEALAKAQAEALDLADQLARAKADAYNIEQRYTAYVQRSKAEAAQARGRGREDVLEALIPVLDDIDLARQHGELVGPFASIAEKVEQVLGQNYGLVRYGAEGDEFDPTIHEALMHQPREGVSTDVIAMVMQPGYQVGERVLRPARVGVAGPA